MNQWLESIKDQSLRAKVKRNYLVSGGAIVSLLCDDEPKDYDVYIQDMDTCVELSKYYLKEAKMPNIQVLDGRRKDEYLEAYNGSDGNKRTLAIKNLYDNQVKIAFNGKIQVKKDKKGMYPMYTPLFISENAISLSNKVQIITRFVGTAEVIHSSFDFVHATNYFTSKDGLVLNPKALECIISKVLLYQGSKYPLTSLIRVKKFIKRGWDISSGEMLKIMFQVSKLDLSDIGVLEQQLIGVDVLYFHKLIEVINKSNATGEPINEDDLFVYIDGIFNEDNEEEEDDEDDKTE
jgi:hypothetical protein